MTHDDAQSHVTDRERKFTIKWARSGLRSLSPKTALELGDPLTHHSSLAELSPVYGVLQIVTSRVATVGIQELWRAEL